MFILLCVDIVMCVVSNNSVLLSFLQPTNDIHVSIVRRLLYLHQTKCISGFLLFSEIGECLFEINM